MISTDVYGKPLLCVLKTSIEKQLKKVFLGANFTEVFKNHWLVLTKHRLKNGLKWPFLGQTSVRFFKSSGWFWVNIGEVFENHWLVWSKLRRGFRKPSAGLQ